MSPSASTRVRLRRSWTSGRFDPCRRSASSVDGPEADQDDHARDEREDVLPRAGRHPHGGRGPQARRRGQPADHHAVLEDRAGAQEADSDTTWAAIRVGSTSAVYASLHEEPVDREHGEQPRPESDEHVRPDPGRVVVDLAFGTDRAPEAGRDEQADRQVELECDVDHRAARVGMAEIIATGDVLLTGDPDPCSAGRRSPPRRVASMAPATLPAHGRTDADPGAGRRRMEDRATRHDRVMPSVPG